MAVNLYMPPFGLNLFHLRCADEHYLPRRSTVRHRQFRDLAGDYLRAGNLHDAR